MGRRVLPFRPCQGPQSTAPFLKRWKRRKGSVEPQQEASQGPGGSRLLHDVAWTPFLTMYEKKQKPDHGDDGTRSYSVNGNG